MRPRFAPARQRDRGAALITVIFMISVMSVLALSLLTDVNRARLRETGMAQRGQALWYVRGAEALAKTLIGQTMQLTKGRLSDTTRGLDETFRLAVEDGAVTVTVREATNCFNVNALVRQVEKGQFEADPVNGLVLAKVLEATGLAEFDAESLTDALTDWIDSDGSPRPQGAEEAYYVSLPEADPPANRLMEDLVALSAVRGWTPEIMAATRPLLCARPDNSMMVININTLSPEQAPLLGGLSRGLLDVRTAESIVRNRPVGGWADPAELLADPAYAPITPDKRGSEWLGVVSSRFEVEGEVVYRSVWVPFSFVFSATVDGKVQSELRMVGNF